MSTTLKEQKEAFVTGHDGTSPFEIMLLCLAAPIGLYLYLGITHSLSNLKQQILIEFVVIFIPMIICQTHWIYPWGITLLSLELGLALYIYRSKTPKSKSSSSNEKQQQQLSFLSTYRSIVLFCTIIAILSVDFHIFPRRFAKTEISGYGWMDLGAGSFICLGGFVSSYAKGRRFTPNLAKTIRNCIPLVALGIIRLVTNKGLEYQEHVSEYGIHWNFFFTLAFVKILSIGFRWIVGRRRRVVDMCMPLMVLMVYQFFLSVGLQEYIEEAPRRCENGGGMVCDFYAANREGILGCIGYFAMFGISEEIALICIWYDQRATEKNIKKEETQKNDKVPTNHKRLMICSIILWTFHFLLSSSIPTSRRSTNAPFVLWTLATNTTILYVISFVFSLSTSSPPPPILKAVNRNGLLMFLIANLLTGAVNLGVNTIEASDEIAFSIIVVYVGCLAGLALVLDQSLDVTVKLG